ncbi:MAG: arginyltransferase [Planctomycetales bacterium]|nr:arginyltransferase [Planctomycetales bacterium]
MTKEDAVRPATDESNYPPLILGEVTLPPRECSYLPTEEAALAYRQIARISAADYQRYLERGWRRHGAYFFRPQCPACRKCRSLRVDVANFKASKSQRRCWKQNQDIAVQIGPPSLTRDHLDIFNRYHADMHQRRGWPLRETSPEEYFESFLLGNFEFAAEFRYFRAEQLVGVGLVDITQAASSSVYFYHDPDWRGRAPGVFSMLVELGYAKDRGIDHHYLGYWIRECPSMAYKSQYGPHELLQEYVDDNAAPSWLPPQTVVDDGVST